MMNTNMKKFGLQAVFCGVFLMGLFIFNSSPALAQGRFENRYGRQSDQLAQQNGYDTGFQMGLKHGVKDHLQGLNANFRTRAFDDGLAGFNSNRNQANDYKNGFRNGYRNGYNQGYSNYLTYAQEWGYEVDPYYNDSYTQRGRYNDRDNRQPVYDRNDNYNRDPNRDYRRN